MNGYLCLCLILVRVLLTLCARGASDCGQSFLMNEPGFLSPQLKEKFKGVVFLIYVCLFVCFVCSFV